MVSNLKDKKYTKLTKKEIVLISLFQRGGNKTKVHTEEISYRAFQINRDMFSWKLKKFKNFPNLEPVYKTLTHLAEENKVYGGKHEDQNKDGWILTESGLKFCNQDLAEFVDIKKNKSNFQQHEKSFVISIKRSAYFKAWKSNKNLQNRTIYDVADFLKVLTSNTPRLVEKFYETKNKAYEIDEKVYDFLNFIENEHKDLLNEEKRKAALDKSKKQLKKML